MSSFEEITHQIQEYSLKKVDRKSQFQEGSYQVIDYHQASVRKVALISLMLNTCFPSLFAL